MALVGNTNEQKIWNYLKSKGLNNYGIAGLMGNLFAESALNPMNLQNTYEKRLKYTDETYVQAVDSGVYQNFVTDSAGFGIAQWTHKSRKLNLLNFAKSHNKSIGDLEMQLDFLYEELRDSFKTVLSALKTATSVKEASDIVLFKFENPNNKSEEIQEKRAKYGQTYFNSHAVSSNAYINNKMKYNEKNKPLICMMTNSTCYKETKKMEIKGVLWHSTGANNPYLKRYVQPSDNATNKSEFLSLLGENKYKNDWNHISRYAGLNCWIGKLADGTVTTVQTMPWDYRPWGCGSGKKGSCNDGWIQFEICEDDLADKNYFAQIYEEACEITAYLCDMYKIDPNGTVMFNGTNIPTILCHADSYKLGFGSNHGDVLNWFNKHGKTMEDVRKDVSELMKTNNSSTVTSNNPASSNNEIYRIRKKWDDKQSQVGAYHNLDAAITICTTSGGEYKVYDSNGVIVYPVEEQKEILKSNDFNIGDEVKLITGAMYTSGKAIPSWVFEKTLYVRDLKENAAVISTVKVGAITGTVSFDYLQKKEQEIIAFTPYKVKVKTVPLNIKQGAGTNYATCGKIEKTGVFTIVEEATGAGASKWGLLKSYSKNRNGWISLDCCQKV